MTATIQGVHALNRKLKIHERSTEKGVRVGLFRAGLFLQRESQKIVPVDTALLKNSANTRIEGTGFDAEVIVSYSTNYAVYVHEDLNAKHKAGKVAKYLEKPLREKYNRMSEIFTQGVKENLR